MPTIDGAAAARTLLGYGTLSKRGACLYYVWLAMKAHGATSSVTYPTAYSAWQVTKRRHFDRNPPAGATVYWGRRRSDGNMAGDITISLGGGRVAATDYPGWNQVGSCTIAQRESQINREYLGWAEDFIGNTTVIIGGTSGGNGMLTVDGEWGPATTSKLQSVLGVTVDGQIGPQTISALQGRLGVTVDGQIGPQTISAIQRVVGSTVDGILGPNTVKALQTYLNNGGTFGAAPAPTPAPEKLVVDGDWGPATTRAFQKSLGVTQDGELGPITWKAFQTAVDITADGIDGPQTYKALQMNVGATVDGALGPETVKKLQEFLNAGKAWTKVTAPTEPTEPSPAVARTPVYPEAVRGWTVPLSSDRAAGSVINRLIVHHTTNTGDEEPYFKTKNDRSSCPTWYVKANGEVVEMIAPEKRPSSTGSANTYSVAIETQNTSGSPTWGISGESHEAIAEIAAWLSKQETFGGFRVDIKLDRTHIIGHNEAGVNATSCPGPSMELNRIVARAIELAAPTEPGGVTLTRAQADRIDEMLDEIRAILGAS